jgi:SagB-type dehydrogenase family enzyme
LRLQVGQKGKEEREGERVIIPLSQPELSQSSLEKTIADRRSCRTFSDQPLSFDHISTLLWAAQGVTGRHHGRPLRAVPSGGGRYPFDLYLFIHKAEVLSPGLYLYKPGLHAVQQIRLGNFVEQLSVIGLGQELFHSAGAVFVLAAEFERICSKYGERGYRYVYMEAGHISQNIALEATSLGVGSVPVGAFYDGDLNQLIGLDGEKRAAIYMHAVGTLSE